MTGPKGTTGLVLLDAKCFFRVRSAHVWLKLGVQYVVASVSIVLKGFQGDRMPVMTRKDKREVPRGISDISCRAEKPGGVKICTWRLPVGRKVELVSL